MKRRGLIGATIVAALFVPWPASAACHTASFDPETYQVRERDGRVRITVNNPGGAPGDRRVDYETVDGSARAGRDYAARSGTLAFTITDRTETIDIPITNDSNVEGAETFQVRLKERAGSCIDTLGDPATVTISDDDQAAQPTGGATPTGTPTTASPTPTSTSPSPTAPGTATTTPAALDDDGGGLGGGAVAGIVAGTIVVGGLAAYFIRRRLLS